jgi:dipeptidase D
MLEVLKGLHPEKLWELFTQIASIPHGSKNEVALAVHLRQVAEDAGFAVKQDDAGNMCISLPATPGYKEVPTVILQGHLDMVCEKNEAVDFDFKKDVIRLVRDGDWLKADGTTLGADNGIGVAAALAIALSENIIHGPLEILLTVDEETGLTGARGLFPSLLSGRIMLNLDSEKTGTVCIGCAGGGGVTTHLPLNWTDTPDGTVGLELKLTGLRGGHSGLDINKNLGNAVKLMTRNLHALKKLDIMLADFQSGDKQNAIPREGSATLILPFDHVPKARRIISENLREFRAWFPNEHYMYISATQINPPSSVLSRESFENVLNMLMAFPNGVLAMSHDIPDLVETSNNLASAHLKGGILITHNGPRSSLSQALQATVDQIVAVSNLAGATNHVEKPYPGWQPNPDSKILHILEDVHEELFGNRPEREAIHAGLECGIIGEKFGGMDMVSFGPDIVNAHSPDETVKISSVETFWRLLAGVLDKIAKGAYQQTG